MPLRTFGLYLCPLNWLPWILCNSKKMEQMWCIMTRERRRAEVKWNSYKRLSQYSQFKNLFFLLYFDIFLSKTGLLFNRLELGLGEEIDKIHYMVCFSWQSVQGGIVKHLTAGTSQSTLMDDHRKPRPLSWWIIHKTFEMPCSLPDVSVPVPVRSLHCTKRPLALWNGPFAPSVWRALPHSHSLQSEPGINLNSLLLADGSEKWSL